MENLQTMKTIEEMSRDYQRSDEDDGTTATAFQNGAEWMREELIARHEAEISAYKKAVKEGLQRENIAQSIIVEKRKEITRLTKWHDPKEELPDNNHCVLIKIADGPQERIHIGSREGDVWIADGGNLFHTDPASVIGYDSVVIGWREIHE